ncbi:MAG TPA: hypothetical protein VFP56_04705 [Candidatus Limnocylindrales bacterium]|nr:hypothetical protein [Candidatus Limnocylindrales bacterium]
MTFGSAEMDQVSAAARVPWRAPAGARLASLAPFFLAVALQLFAPRYFPPLFAAPPDVMGVPLGVIVGALALAWAAFGALVVWTTHSRVAAALALAFLTLPSMFALLLGPAVVLILQNLG